MRVNSFSGQQADILREHAEHQAVDEMGDRLRGRGPVAQTLRQRANSAATSW